MSYPIPEKRIAEFENLGFGMFIHFGLYSILGRGEWVQHHEKIPREEYEKLAKSFSVPKYDARKIVKAAKDAGAKYITLTTRHHDGFSLYDTKGLSDYDAPHSLCGRDLIREYVDACNEEGIKPFFYHTTIDWHHPEFEGDFDKYLEYLRDSVKVLCTEYGKIGGLWFDGNWWPVKGSWQEDKLYAVIRRYQPDAIIVNNTGLSARGEAGNKELDSVTFEQGRPEPMNREGMEKYLAAEMCHTMNDHWGYGSADFNYKSLPELIETLCSCRRVGANYLLNVGPTGEGEIPFIQEALLHGIGDWIRIVGDSLYEGKPCGVGGIDNKKDFGLKKGNKLYLYIHDLAKDFNSNVDVAGAAVGCGNRAFAGIKDKVVSARWTDRDENLEFTQNGEGFSLNCTPYTHDKNLVVRVAELTLGE